MKALSSVVALGAVASLAFAPASFAAFSCPDRTPTAITAPGTDVSRACQNAIGKAAADYVKAQVKTEAKCMVKQDPGACPNSKDSGKIEKAALKARDAIVAACGGAGALAGLSSSYSGVSDPEQVTSCTLSQNNADGRLLAFKVNGTPGNVKPSKPKDKCVKTLNNAGVKYALSALKTINKCLDAGIKANVGGDLAARCVGHWAANVFVAPTDEKAADALAKALDKVKASIDKACAPVVAPLRQTIFACPGASSIEDFQECIACGSWDSLLNIFAAQYSEGGTFVAHAAGAIQAAVDASGPGAKLLIESGLYQEDVSVTSNVLHAGTQFVGCGGATNARPQLQPPTIGGPYLNGIFAAGVDGLVFQSIEVSGGWDENGIFVTGADGVTFRDVIANGDDLLGVSTSTYGIFPVESNNVLIEISKAVNIRDAGLYVGSCTNMVVRYNVAEENVAGIEIENSTNASVHNNYTHNNVGGLLVFKLPGPAVQRGNDHEIFFNVIDANNVSPNFGIPGTTVAGIPPGTGVVVMSVKDCDFHHNLVQDNNSYGFAVIDQNAFDVLAGGAFGGDYSHTCEAPDAPYQKCTVATQATDCPLSNSCVQDQMLTGNKVRSNLLLLNGLAPDPNAVYPNNVLYAVFEEDLPDGNNNCFSNNDEAYSPLVNVFGPCL